MTKHKAKDHMIAKRSFHWRAPEFVYKKKTAKWYLAIGIFFLIILSVFILGKSWFAAMIVALSFWLFLSYAEKHPKLVDYKVDNTGITIGDKVITYGEIHSFTVDTTGETQTISLNTNYPFAMPVTMVVKKDNIDDVLNILIEHIPYQRDLSFLRWLTRLLHY